MAGYGTTDRRSERSSPARAGPPREQAGNPIDFLRLIPDHGRGKLEEREKNLAMLSFAPDRELEELLQKLKVWDSCGLLGNEGGDFPAAGPLADFLQDAPEDPDEDSPNWARSKKRQEDSDSEEEEEDEEGDEDDEDDEDDEEEDEDTGNW